MLPEPPGFLEMAAQGVVGPLLQECQAFAEALALLLLLHLTMSSLVYAGLVGGEGLRELDSGVFGWPLLLPYLLLSTLVRGGTFLPLSGRRSLRWRRNRMIGYEYPKEYDSVEEYLSSEAGNWAEHVYEFENPIRVVPVPGMQEIVPSMIGGRQVELLLSDFTFQQQRRVDMAGDRIHVSGPAATTAPLPFCEGGSHGVAVLLQKKFYTTVCAHCLNPVTTSFGWLASLVLNATEKAKVAWEAVKGERMVLPATKAEALLPLYERPAAATIRDQNSVLLCGVDSAIVRLDGSKFELNLGTTRSPMIEDAQILEACGSNSYLPQEFIDSHKLSQCKMFSHVRGEWVSLRVYQCCLAEASTRKQSVPAGYGFLGGGDFDAMAKRGHALRSGAPGVLYLLATNQAQDGTPATLHGESGSPLYSGTGAWLGCLSGGSGKYGVFLTPQAWMGYNPLLSEVREEITRDVPVDPGV